MEKPLVFLILLVCLVIVGFIFIAANSTSGQQEICDELKRMRYEVLYADYTCFVHDEAGWHPVSEKPDTTIVMPPPVINP